MKLSIVATMYYSQNYLHEFYNRTMLAVKEIDCAYEFILVNDGSPDDSLRVALQLQQLDHNIKIIDLSRNFGHQRAIMTGLQHTTGDYVFLIDCDLEEDPNLLVTFWEKLIASKNGDVVYGVQASRKGKWFERVSGRLFYNLVSLLSSVEYPADTLTARIMTRAYVDAVRKFSEKELDVWGVFVLVGFNQIPVVVSKGDKGSTTFTIQKKIRRAVEIITSFSHRPLYITFFFGAISSFIALVNIGIIVYKKMVLHIDVEGWASILASVWLIGGMILLMLGIFGLYLSKMFLEIKNRPLTIIKNIYSQKR